MADRKVYVEVEWDDKDARAKAKAFDAQLDQGQRSAEASSQAMGRLEAAVRRYAAASTQAIQTALGQRNAVQQTTQAVQQATAANTSAAQATQALGGAAGGAIPPVVGLGKGLGGVGGAAQGATTGVKSLFKEIFLGNITALAAWDTIKGLSAALWNFSTGILSQAVDASNQATKALIGLSSVSRAFGINVEEANQAAKNLASDGLITVYEAADSLKNLLGARFNLQQSIDLMHAFKDAAAFNRQGMLEFGQAIVGATQGLKNQMSMMVDNVGITKNLGMILKEAGYAETDLGRVASDNKVRLALYNGILKEAVAFKGDAARAAQTYTGQLDKLNTVYRSTLATWGDAITQNRTVAEAMGWVTQKLQDMNIAATKNGEAWNIVSDVVVFFTRLAAGALNALDLLQMGMHGLKIVAQELVGGIVNLTGIVVNLGIKAMEANRAINPALWFSEENKRQIQEMKDGLKDLEERYNSIADTTNADLERTQKWGNALQSGAAQLRVLAQELEKTRGTAIEYGRAGQTVSDTQAQQTKEAQKLSDSVAKLTEEITKAQASGLFTPTGMVLEFGAKAAEMFRDLYIAARPIPPLIRAMAEAHNTLELDKLNQSIAKGTVSWQDYYDIIHKLADQQGQRIVEAFFEQREALEETADQLVIFTNLETEAAKRTRELEEAAKTAALDGLQAMFVSLGQISGGLGGVFGQLGQVVAGLKAANDMTRQTGQHGERLGGTFGALSVMFNDMATKSQKWSAGFAVVAGAIRGVQEVMAATVATSNVLQNSLNGALAGAQAGAMFGPVGMGIGAGVGFMTGLLRGKPTWAKALKEVARDFGVDVSEELSKAITATAKTQTGGNRQAASLLHLADIIKEAGGLSEQNLPQMTARLRDLFVMLETGALSTSQVMQGLEQNWEAFAKTGTDATGALSAGLREVLQLAGRTGTVTTSMSKYMQQQAMGVVSATSAILAASDAVKQTALLQPQITKALADRDKALADADKMLANWRPGQNDPDTLDATRRYDEAQARLDGLLAQLRSASEAAKAELSDLSVIAVGSFGAAVATGASFVEALKAAQSGLKDLTAATQFLGVTAEDAGMQTLLVSSQMLDANPKLLAGVDGLAQSFTGLANIGLLNEDTFRAMERQGMRMFTQLQAESARFGGGQREALLPMQDYLQRAEAEARALGIPLAENTQMLIDQSKELGIWREKGKSANEQLTDGLRDLVGVMREFIDTLRGVPPVVRTTVEVTRTVVDGGGQAQEVFHSGGYIGRGGRNVSITAQEGEFVLSRAAVNRMGVPMLEALNEGRTPDSGGGGGIAVTVGNITVGEGVDEAEVAARVGRQIVKQMKRQGVRFTR